MVGPVHREVPDVGEAVVPDVEEVVVLDVEDAASQTVHSIHMGDMMCQEHDVLIDGEPTVNENKGRDAGAEVC